MLPIRNKTIFRSRWWALAWAAGITWSAVEFAGGQPAPEAGNTSGNAVVATDVTGAPVTADEAKKAAAVLDNWGK